MPRLPLALLSLAVCLALAVDTPQACHGRGGLWITTDAGGSGGDCRRCPDGAALVPHPDPYEVIARLEKANSELRAQLAARRA